MKIATTLSLLLLAGCASKPAPPAWKSNASGLLDAFTEAYLKGNTSIAETEFTRARSETASTGRPDIVAQAELIKCAAHTASLEFDGCPAFAALAPDATPAQRAYAAYIDGRWLGLEVALLPEQHRPVVTGGSLASVVDPLSRAVAAGALFKAERISPADIELATENASGQGWRRPLLMWLGVSEKRAQAAGDTAAVARIQRRIALAAAN